MKKKKFNIPPIALVIVGVIVLVVSVGVIIKNSTASADMRDFLKNATTTQAMCLGKSEFTQTDNGRNVVYQSLHVSFSIGSKPYDFYVDVPDLDENSVEPGQEFTLYYDRDNPYDCLPEAAIPQPETSVYIIAALFALGGAALAWINVDVIFRNRGPAAQKLEQEEIGIFGDNTVDNGLSDSSIDYGAGDRVTDSVTESFVDPFATYTGYDEGSEQPEAGAYFDPNAGYDQSVSYDEAPGAAYGSGAEYDPNLNDPFVSNVSEDPFR